MQLDAGKHCTTQTRESGVLVGASGSGNESTVDGVVPDTLDIGLFRALRKLDTPKHRVCSALWLSYAEYDELSRLI